MLGPFDFADAHPHHRFVHPSDRACLARLHSNQRYAKSRSLPTPHVPASQPASQPSPAQPSSPMRLCHAIPCHVMRCHFSTPTSTLTPSSPPPSSTHPAHYPLVQSTTNGCVDHWYWWAVAKLVNSCRVNSRSAEKIEQPRSVLTDSLIFLIHAISIPASLAGQA
jgi:hypothetical protein